LAHPHRTFGPVQPRASNQRQPDCTASTAATHRRLERTSQGITAEIHIGAIVFTGLLLDVTERSFGLSGLDGLRLGDAVTVKLPVRRALRGHVLQADSGYAHVVLSMPLHPDDPLLNP
jgi:hypothetical protein